MLVLVQERVQEPLQPYNLRDETNEEGGVEYYGAPEGPLFSCVMHRAPTLPIGDLKKWWPSCKDGANELRQDFGQYVYRQVIY